MTCGRRAIGRGWVDRGLADEWLEAVRALAPLCTQSCRCWFWPNELQRDSGKNEAISEVGGTKPFDTVAAGARRADALGARTSQRIRRRRLRDVRSFLDAFRFKSGQDVRGPSQGT